MIARGAPVLPDEIEPLTSFLTATFGPDSSSAQRQASQAAPSSTSQSTQALMEERCALCHPIEQVTAVRKSEAEWKETIARMLIYGAQLTADEQQLIEVFLAENFAP